MWQGFRKNHLFRKKYDENSYFVVKLLLFGAIFGRFCSPKRQSITLERVESHPQRGEFFRWNQLNEGLYSHEKATA